MLYNLEGTVVELSSNLAVINCNGLGFEVTITPNTAAALKLNENARLYLCESIGEDHFDLFGFLSKKEKQLYTMLTGVSGIGPKAAMSILSYNSFDNLALAIVNSDETALTSCPGIGKKTAQRVILELKDKIGKEFNSFDFSTTNTVVIPNNSTELNSAISALLLLGYTNNDIQPVIKQIDINGLNSEQIIKAVLKYMI